MFLLPALAGILGGIVEVLLKITVSKKYSSVTYVFLINSLVTLIMIPFVLSGSKFPSTFYPWLILVFNILMYIGSNLCLITAFKYEDISNVSLIYRISLVLTFFMDLLLFKEVIDLAKLLGIIFISLAIVIVFFDREKFNNLKIKGILFALATGIFVSFANIAAKFNSNFFTSNIFIFFMFSGQAFSMLFFPSVKSEMKKLFLQENKKLFLIAILGLTSYFLLIESYRRYSVSISYIIISAVSIAIVVIYGIYILQEKRKLLNKLVGLIFVIVGLFLLRR